MGNFGIVTTRIMPNKAAPGEFIVTRSEMTPYGLVRVHGRGKSVRLAREDAAVKHDAELAKRVERSESRQRKAP